METNMNDHTHDDDRPLGVDEDRTEGSLKQAGGKIKEGVGSLLGDEKTKREGEADQAEGKIQNTWGSAKDKAREVLDGDHGRDDD
jgi:uncharacterized protein YjbJ (UPF0337 family)